MRLIYNLTKSDQVLSFRRSFIIIFGAFYLLLLAAGVLMDIARPQSYPWSYAAIITAAYLVGAGYIALIGIAFAVPRYMRRQALARQVAPLDRILIDVYLTRRLREFLQSVTGRQLTDAAESVTLDFRHDEARVWYGASKPAAFDVAWIAFPAVSLTRIGRRHVSVKFSPRNDVSASFEAFVPCGVLGIRHRGVADLVARIEAVQVGASSN